MGLTREEQQLIMRVVGASDVRELTEEIRREELAIIDATEKMRSHAITNAQWQASVSASTATIAANKDAIAKIAKDTNDYRQNLLGLSYVANDFFSVSGGMTQRLNAVANNMPMLLTGFGSWGLVLSGLLPILGALTPALTSLWNAATGGGQPDPLDRLETLKERIKELEKIKVRPAIDTAELERAREEVDRIQAGMKAFKKWESTRTANEAEVGNEIKDIVTEELGGERATQILRTQMIKEGTAQSQTLRETEEGLTGLEAERGSVEKKLQETRDAGTARMLQAQLAQLPARKAEMEEKRRKARQAIEQDAETRAGELLDKATKGDDQARRELGNRIGAEGARTKDARLDAIGRSIFFTDKDLLQSQREQDSELEDSIDAMRTQRKTREKTERDEEKYTDERFEEGITAMRKQVSKETAANKQRTAENTTKAKAKEAERKKGSESAASAIAKTPLGATIEQAAAVYRQRGGYYETQEVRDKHGRRTRQRRLVKLDDAGQQNALRQDIQRQLLRANRKMDPKRANEVATELAKDAFGKVDAQNAAAKVDPAGAAQQFIEENHKVQATHAAEIQRLWQLFGPAAAAQRAAAIQQEEQLRAARVQSFSYLTGVPQ